MGILVLAGITIVALATSDLGGTLAVRTETAVCTALGGADCGGGPGPVAQAPTAGEQVLAAQASGSGPNLNVPNDGAAPPAPGAQGRAGPGEADPAQAAPAQAAPAPAQGAPAQGQPAPAAQGQALAARAAPAEPAPAQQGVSPSAIGAIGGVQMARLKVASQERWKRVRGAGS